MGWLNCNQSKIVCVSNRNCSDCLSKRLLVLYMETQSCVMSIFVYKSLVRRIRGIKNSSVDHLVDNKLKISQRMMVSRLSWLQLTSLVSCLEIFNTIVLLISFEFITPWILIDYSKDQVLLTLIYKVGQVSQSWDNTFAVIDNFCHKQKYISLIDISHEDYFLVDL